MSDTPKLKPEDEIRMWKDSSGKAQVELQDEQQRRIYYQRKYLEAKQALKTLFDLLNVESPYD